MIITYTIYEKYLSDLEFTQNYLLSIGFRIDEIITLLVDQSYGWGL